MVSILANAFTKITVIFHSITFALFYTAFQLEENEGDLFCSPLNLNQNNIQPKNIDFLQKKILKYDK